MRMHVRACLPVSQVRSTTLSSYSTVFLTSHYQGSELLFKVKPYLCLLNLVEFHMLDSKQVPKQTSKY